MKAEELRIGNYYKCFDGTIDGYRIHQIVLRDFAYIGDAGGDFGNYGFKPIPLTEEWLIKFGFEKKKHIYPDNSKSFDYWFNSWYVRFDIDIGIIIIGRLHFQDYQYLDNIKHVHQLQNLYFALTGTELKLT